MVQIMAGVLAGFQVPENELADFQQFLDKLGYRYGDETQNPAYQLFLSGVSR